MAELKDKVVTVESLNAVHTHGKNTYMTKSNPNGSGMFSMDGNGSFSGSVNVNSLIMGNTVLSYDEAEGALKVSFLINENNENIE